jgi:hypothetical protein
MLIYSYMHGVGGSESRVGMQDGGGRKRGRLFGRSLGRPGTLQEVNAVHVWNVQYADDCLVRWAEREVISDVCVR